MKLTVRLFAHLRERAGRPEIRLEDLAEGLDVAGLKREIERLGQLSQDDARAQTDLVQKATDAAVTEIDQVVGAKEAEILQV